MYCVVAVTVKLIQRGEDKNEDTATSLSIGTAVGALPVKKHTEYVQPRTETLRGRSVNGNTPVLQAGIRGPNPLDSTVVQHPDSV